MDTVRISRSADPSSYWTDEDPERDSDLPKVTQQVRGRTGTRTQDSCLSVWSFPGCVQRQKQHILGKVLLIKLSGVGFALSPPVYHGLPCFKILIVGVSAIIHFFPNGMLASDKEPVGKMAYVIWKLMSSPSVSRTGRFSHSSLADGEMEAQNREMSLGLLI